MVASHLGLLTLVFLSGLGLTLLIIEALLHCLSGTLALPAAGEHLMTRDEQTVAANLC